MFAQILRRPVLAIVVSILIVLIGLLAIRTRPISQFPEIAPPQVQVTISYPGASADVLVQSSLILLERAINGVPGMRYMISDATSAGEATIQVIFDLDTDPDQAIINVKTRIDQVMPNLPKLVQLEGVILMRVMPSMLMYVNVYSTAEDADEKFLFNFANVNVLPEIMRVKGIGQARILGSRQFAMRIWLNPDRMRAYNVSAEEVMEAVGEQSVIGRPGRVGQATGKTAQSLEYVLVYEGRFNKPEQYEDIIIRASPDGQVLRLKDVAKVELGSEFFNIYSNLDGHPSAAIVLKQTLGSNAQEVIANVKARLEEIKASTFPPGMDFAISYDVSRFVDASIEQVTHTLVEAFVLVALVVFVFLGDWRSTLIPTLAVPVSLVGAFIFMAALGISINLITLFALVLAIGIVVDDAIVVVEAVHAKMEAKHLAAYEAMKEVLNEISGAIIAITLVMTSVFVPVAFMPGPVGVFYRQFSVTMASSIVLSGFIALTLTPVLSVLILKPVHGHGKTRNPITLFIRGFNRVFNRATSIYIRLMRAILGRFYLTLLALGLFVFGIFQVNRVLPAGFVPNEDQGIIYAIIQTPPGSTLERTNAVAESLQEIAKEMDEVASVSSLAGYEILTEGRASNAGTCLINLKDWSERHKSVTEVIEELEEKAKDIGAVVEFFEPPAVPGYGAAGGVSFRMLEKTGSTDYYEFDRVNQEFMAALRERPELTGLFTFYAANYPQYELVIDNQKAMQKGVSIGKAMENLDLMIGSSYEQGFIRFGFFYRVYVQALPEYRALPPDVLKMYVKNDAGEMVPYSSFMTIKKRQGPNEITRYNMYNSSAIRGNNAPGYTTGDAVKAIKEVAAEVLPRGYDIAWEGLSYDEAQRGNEAIYIFAIVLVFVYLVLAAQYESFVLPLAVITSLPAGAFGSFLFLKVMGLANDIYAQVGLVMLVGLLGKNAVLIVEFAVQTRREGATVFEAAIAGAKARFRAILMTSFAFVAGLYPLVVAKGAGAVGNNTIGSSALGGMVMGTVFGVILIPGLYFIFGHLERFERFLRIGPPSAPTEPLPLSEVSLASIIVDTLADAEPTSERRSPNDGESQQAPPRVTRSEAPTRPHAPRAEEESHE
ncbi:hydrophobic/amphiphilic exporter-1, HAE1 family [Nannocystis exedens]|uniref:Hydrophobic/amphiphilic exporter-1, HAE1 family n=1 Tax=Nannocystis exedens TaxID=54 RepID=A0A1I2CTK2_9BACT|nr:efflux RND transporter permease subunit [Nannocystis exedens]PCC68548.1 multidrug transporter AcrB [Nannocystis exedens]SFE71666.1 hydrophobic/amphiphilic exporter-1, HAE1 family [Nannocystis exedens]